MRLARPPHHIPRPGDPGTLTRHIILYLEFGDRLDSDYLACLYRDIGVEDLRRQSRRIPSIFE